MSGEPAAAPALALIGPTASGKTALALQLAEALGGEIVSIDSAAVYRGLDIGSAKPTPEERRRVPHHLVDIADPHEPYSAGRFVRDAQAAVADIRARGGVPILAGGTMLYVRALLLGLAELPQADPALRAALDARIEREGLAAAHAELARRDPLSGARIQPADRQRIQRALELLELTGKPLDVLFREHARPPALQARVLALLPGDRAAHHAAIDARFAAMLRAGLVDELRGLRARFALHADLPAMRSVGYRQAWAYLQGEMDEAGLLEAGQAASRQLAKRQMTWLRQLPAELALDPQRAGWQEAAMRWARSAVSAIQASGDSVAP
ncbi:MAG: tRNA (adenosine(37)-N6)-dimethylallyltransferase MiaA [Rhodocyclaceae bacterium]|nr:tRNA (adenosine(37)-N6)-dimethylallyltransferase MiaA [Rhodocyclaceae bacterium]